MKGYIVAVLLALCWSARAQTSTTAGFTTPIKIIYPAPLTSCGGTSATGINNLGHVVGTYVDQDCGGGIHSFIWRNGKFTLIPNLPRAVNGTLANGISPKEDAVVGTYLDREFGEHGFIYFVGNYASYDYPVAQKGTTRLLSINSEGEMAGVASLCCGFGGVSFISKFLERNGRVIAVPKAFDTQVSGVNNLGYAVGWYGDGKGTHGFLLRNRQFTTLDYPGANLGSGGTLPLGISPDADVVVGQYYDKYDNIHGFVYFDGKYVNYDFPNAPGGTVLTGINDDGDLVGSVVGHINSLFGFVVRRKE